MISPPKKQGSFSATFSSTEIALTQESSWRKCCGAISQLPSPPPSLRKAIWKLRHALDSQAERLSNHLLLVCSDWIQLNPEAELWLDVQVFEQTFNDAKAQTGGELEETCIQDLKMAVELFRGGLQENWYSDWYLLERERFQHEYLIILDRLIEYCEANQRYMEGVTYSNLILHYEKARERTHRQLMRLFALAKDRSAALNQYQRCVQILSEELGVNPSKRTVLLHQQIVDDQWPEPGSLWEKEAVPGPGSSLAAGDSGKAERNPIRHLPSPAADRPRDPECRDDHAPTLNPASRLHPKKRGQGCSRFPFITL
jgi:DNA-binding SARP family transcriptional activator